MLKKTIPEEVTEFIAKEDQRLRSGVVGSLAIAPITPEIHRPGKPAEREVADSATTSRIKTGNAEFLNRLILSKPPESLAPDRPPAGGRDRALHRPPVAHRTRYVHGGPPPSRQPREPALRGFCPPAVRPPRPLPRAAVCAAIAAASFGGQRGNRISISSAIWAIKAQSCSFRRKAPTALPFARSLASSEHSCSALSNAEVSTRMPCRS